MRHRAEEHRQLDRQENICSVAAATIVPLQQQALQGAHYTHSRYGFDWRQKRAADETLVRRRHPNGHCQSCVGVGKFSRPIVQWQLPQQRLFPDAGR